MPQNKFALARYQIIDSLLRRNAYVKTAKIVECCNNTTGYRVTQRTIQLDIATMRSDPFVNYNAPIQYSQSRKAYYYEDKSYVLFPFSFTIEELGVVEILRSIVEESIPKDMCNILDDLVTKIRFYVDK